VYQTAKGSSDSYGALGDSPESTERFPKYLDIYTKILPTPAMDDIMVKITAELPFTSHWRRRTSESKLGQSSKSVLMMCFTLLSAAQWNV
jgi:hypothetical protein